MTDDGGGEVQSARCEVRGARCEVRGARCVSNSGNSLFFPFFPLFPS